MSEAMEWRRTAGGYERVPKRGTARVVTLDAGVVRGSTWKVWRKPGRGHAAELTDRTTTSR
jgi:hypothetical protein